mmetsp:Transcript_65770/g.130319  ORF Transcript_65770/g.130319 Transcript_65770/m.130319 type:complete len:301 (-) Transcript_65770:266-1168(-)
MALAAAANDKLTRMLSGAVAGALSSIVLQPLDVLTTRMQMSDRQSRPGMLATAVDVYHTGGLLALWAGAIPSMLRLAFGIALYFLVLGEAEQLSRHFFGQLDGLAAAARDFAVGGLSRGMAVIAFCPLTVIKTRAEAGKALPAAGGAFGQLVALARLEGSAGLFSGLLAALLRDVPYSGLSLLLMRGFRHEAIARGISPALSTSLAGAASATCATLLTQPADCIRTYQVLDLKRDADRRKRDGDLNQLRALNAPQAFAHIVRTRGPLALFAGTAPRLTRRTLQQAITWGTLELTVGAQAK